MSPYLRFAVNVSVSPLIMTALIYLNLYAADYLNAPQTELFMVLIMGVMMALIEDIKQDQGPR